MRGTITKICITDFSAEKLSVFSHLFRYVKIVTSLLIAKIMTSPFYRQKLRMNGTVKPHSNGLTTVSLFAFQSFLIEFILGELFEGEIFHQVGFPHILRTLNQQLNDCTGLSQRDRCELIDFFLVRKKLISIQPNSLVNTAELLELGIIFRSNDDVLANKTAQLFHKIFMQNIYYKTRKHLT